ncbi:hypothetical protein, conserved [Eimeria brunetti]|uniref:Uncharacterized protein n=1 Tax=Eimeria brunetti TaxID=51314 RepID=U6LIV9_9EIME|nr:hypothetical protein, conserved [Eimeria brunetti]
MPPVNIEVPREFSQRSSIDLKEGDWWILGSTNYAVVDPTRRRTSSDLVKRFERPKQLTDDLYESGWLARSLGSKTLGLPDRRRSSSFRMQLLQENEEGKGKEDYRTLQSSIRYAGATPAAGAAAAAADSRGGNLQPMVSRLQSSVISIPAIKGSLFVPGGSSVTVKYHAKLPSFRAIVRQMQEESQHRRLSEISVLPPEGQGSTVRVPSSISVNAESSISFSRTASSGVKYELNPRSGTGSSAFGASLSSADSVYRKLARERLKRSFTRLATRMRNSVSSGQIGEPEDDVSLKDDNLDPAVADLHKQTISILRQVEKDAHLLHKEMRSLQRAAEIAEEIVSQLKPELEAKDHQADPLKKPSSRRDRLGIRSLQLFGLEVVEPHAAMTESQLKELKKARETAREKNQHRLEDIKRLHEHLNVACECLEQSKKAPATTSCSALSIFDKVAERWATGGQQAYLFLPAALASLACTVACDICTIGSTEVAAQTLASLLFHSGSGEAAKKVAEASFRHSLMYDSMVGHKGLIEKVAVKVLALVLDEDARSSRRSSLQLQVPGGESSSEPALTSKPSLAGDSAASRASTRACLLNIVSVAQQAIMAMHEAGGRRGEPVSLEREAERHRDPRVSRNERALLRKLEFALLELRLLVNKLIALRLAQSELGCTQQAWDKINEFNSSAADLLSQYSNIAQEAD